MDYKELFDFFLSSRTDFIKLMADGPGRKDDGKRHSGRATSGLVVKVNAGDGIGFDIGDFVVVTNSKNNVGMLVKANYDKPFERCDVYVSDKPMRYTKDLVAGRTYYTLMDGELCFVKYLGHDMCLMVWGGDIEIRRLEGRLSVSFFELSLSADD